MKETAPKYVERLLGYTQGQKPLKVQATTANTLTRLIKGVSPTRLRKRPTPEQWSVAEILAHFADAEVAISWRLRAILGAPGTAISAFDQDAWAAAGHYSTRDPHQCIEHFRANRKANLSLLNSLTPEQWGYYGMHSERGKETIEHIVALIAGHDLNHLRQIESILASPKKKPVRMAA